MTQSMQETEEDVSVAVATGAVILGTADGVMNVVADNATLASKLIEPGDQRHIAHPLNDFVAGISGARQALTTPGDMNIKYSAHPIDSAMNVPGALVTATTDNFTQQGFVQGLRTSSAVAAGVIVGVVIHSKN